jgi:hypothetical protein
MRVGGLKTISLLKSPGWLSLVALTGCLSEFPAAPGFDAGALDTGARDQGRADGARDAISTDQGGLDRGPDARVPADAGRDATQDAALTDQGGGDATVDAFDVPDGCMPMDEICNGQDDNCDGRIDNLDVLQAPCRVPGLECTGALRCDVALQALVCEPVPGAMEQCDGRDEDCDGQIDEDAQDTTGPCSVGLGACTRIGRLFCQDAAPACDAAPGDPELEICNGLDDNCNGEVDDATGIGDACVNGVGPCAQRGELICQQGSAAPVCSANPRPPGVESCNGVDDDCNTLIDDVAGAGLPCSVGVGACARRGENACRDGQLRCSVEPGPVGAESCNAQDDDCDGRTDEGPVCVDHALRACKVWLGWASPAAPAAPVAQWGANPFCPPNESIQEGADRCVASPGDGELRALSLGMAPAADVHLDDDDALGIAFTCGGGTAVDAWIQQHCRVVLAFASTDARGGVADLDPAACPAFAGPIVGAADAQRARCVATGSDGRFHPLWLSGDATNGAQIGVALRCDDPNQVERARGLDTGLAVTLAFMTSNMCLSGNVVVNDWPACRDAGQGAERCVASGGDRGIHGFIFGDLAGPVGCTGLFGIGLTRVP